MDSNNSFDPDYAEDVLQMPCPSCGGKLSYSAEKKAIHCRSCGYLKDIDTNANKVVEQSLASAEKLMNTYTPQSVAKKVVDCSGCGAQLMIDETDVAVRCNFCGSDKVNQKAFDKNLIKPQGIIPFKIPAQEAKDKFKVWIKKGWFTPNKLKHLAKVGDVHGVYVPFWTYDAQTLSNWSGEAGFHYYETETYTDSDGNTQTKRVRHTRWEYRSGRFDHFFNDLLIVASKGLPHKVITPIYPFELESVVNFDEELIVGWESEIYSLDVKEGYSIAEDKMDSQLNAMASNYLGGDTQRHLRIDTSKWDQTFKHIVLPVWLCSYQYNGKSYQFAVNGQTGKINGSKPTSWIKVTLFILCIAALAFGIYSYIKMQENGAL